MDNNLDKLILKIGKDTKIDDDINLKKSSILESMKPSTKEDILYFLEKDLKDVSSGFAKIAEKTIQTIQPYFEKRSKLEYLPSQRHPIPYCIIKFKDKYFLSLRKNGGGELRLIGQKGLLGGHVDMKDVIYSNNKIDIINTIRNGMARELKEEANLNLSKANNIDFLGFIKIEKSGAVENDHLALVYLIDISSKIKTVEDNILSGIWLTKDEIVKNIDSLESWTKIAFENLFYDRFLNPTKRIPDVDIANFDDGKYVI